MEINCFDTTGKKLKGISVSKAIFGLKPNDKLLAQAIRVYLSNQRRANAKAKNEEKLEVVVARFGGKKEPVEPDTVTNMLLFLLAVE